MYFCLLGLYEKDKTSFKLIVAFKILVTAGKLEQRLISLFLKGGSALDINQVRHKPFTWLSNDSWLNTLQLSNSYLAFKSLPDDLDRGEVTWKAWYDENEPERFPSPIDSKFANDEEVAAAFNRLLLIRCLREDRSLLAVNDFIRRLDGN